VISSEKIQPLKEQDLKVTDILESTQKELAQHVEKLHCIEAERDSLPSELNSKVSQLGSLLSDLEKERAQLAAKIDRPILIRYERMQSALHERVLVPAVQCICTGCNLRLPARLFYEVEYGTVLYSCPHCQRILFIPSSDAKASTSTNPPSNEVTSSGGSDRQRELQRDRTIHSL